MPAAGHFKTGTARLMTLRAGSSVFVSGTAKQVDSYVKVVRRHHPERCFKTEAREGGRLVYRLQDGAAVKLENAPA